MAECQDNLSNIEILKGLPLMKEVSKGINDVGLAEFALNEGHYLR